MSPTGAPNAPTIKNIAQLAGVSRGTVDRVLNCRGGVNSDTALKVKKIADELRYRPNLVAKSLSAKAVNGERTIGVLINSRGNPFFDDVLYGVSAKAAEIQDFGIHISAETLMGYNIDEQLECINRFVEAGVSGIIITPINCPQMVEKLKELERGRIPVVCVNNDVADAPKMCYVGSDYMQCGRVAAGLLGMLSGGRRMKVAVVTGSFMVLGHDLRVRGFKDCVAEEFPNIEIAAIVENGDGDDLSYKVTKEVLYTNPDINGIFFGAAGVEGGLKAVSDAGFLGRIHIVSVDLIDVVKRNLDTGAVTAAIGQEPYKQGYEAVRVMFEYLLADKCPSGDIYTENQIYIKHSLHSSR